VKTLLIFPPWVNLFNNHKQPEGILPLGLASLSAFLKKNGKEVSVMDLNIQTYMDAKKKDQEQWYEKYRGILENQSKFLQKNIPRMNYLTEGWVDKILKSEAKVIGFYISYSTEQMALYLSKKIKEKNKNIRIIFGGPQCYQERARASLESQLVDIVVVGEGEMTLLDIVNNLEKTDQIQACPGMLFMRNGEIIDGGPREFIKDLDSLPYPDFSDFIDDYKNTLGRDYISLTISWLRGCTHQCAFCYESKLWGRPRMRSPQSICHEFIHQKKTYGVSRFFKADSTLAISEKQLTETCDLLINEKADVQWFSQARPEKYLSLELLQKIKKSGCTCLSYGVESGAQSVIKKMNKGFELKSVQEIINNTVKAGIKPAMGLMVDSPGETPIDYIKTIGFMLKNKKYIKNISVASAAVTPMSDWSLHPGKYHIITNDSLRKVGNFPWRTKYYLNNSYLREIKRILLEIIKYAHIVYFKLLSKD